MPAMYRLSVILLATLGVLPAAAQEQAAEPADTERVEDTLEVEDSYAYLPTSNTIATKLPTEQVLTPANIGAVHGALIDEQNARVLGDALANVSGVQPQTGNGVFDFFVLRGFDSLNSGLVLTDGAPEPETTFYHLYDVDRIEVLKGPAGFLYGSNPLAGVVNLVRKQPVPHRLASVGLAAGSFGTSEATFDLNAASPGSDTSFRINGLYRESDGHRDGRDQEVAAIHPSFSWRPDDRSSLTVNFETVSSDYTPDAGLPLVGGELPDVPRERSYASPLDASNQDIVRAQIDYEIQVDDRLTVRDKLYYRELDWNTRGTLLNGVADLGFGPQVFRTQIGLDDRQRFLGNQFEVLWRHDRHDLLAGVELGRYTDDFSLDVALLAPISLTDPVEIPGFPPIPLPGQASAGDSETTIVAPYIVDQIHLSDRFELMLGARFDSIDFDDAATQTSRSDSEVSPMAGVVYSAGPRTWLYANAARSFAPASPRVVGDREPEESEQIEIGVRRHFAGGRLRSTVALYDLERANIAIPDDNGFTQQAGDQRSRGLEIELGGELGHGLNGVFSYAYNDAELTRFSEQIFLPFPPFAVTVDRSGNTPAFAPEHLFNSWLSCHFDSGLTLSGGVRWVDSQFIAEDNETRIGSYALVDASVAYTFNRWRFVLDLSNLADEEYETRGFGSFSVIPGEPLAATLRIGYRM